MLCLDCGVELPQVRGRGRPRERCEVCSDRRAKEQRAQWSKEHPFVKRRSMKDWVKHNRVAYNQYQKEYRDRFK